MENVRRFSIIGLLSLLFFSVAVSELRAGILFEFSSSFKGQVIDADSGQPIEGAYVAMFWGNVHIGWRGKIINMEETVSDKDGRFQLKGWLKLSLSLFEKANARLLICKPNSFGFKYIGFYIREKDDSCMKLWKRPFFREYEKIGFPKDRIFLLRKSKDMYESWFSYVDYLAALQYFSKENLTNYKMENKAPKIMNLIEDKYAQNKNIKLILSRLNLWDKKELELYNRRYIERDKTTPRVSNKTSHWVKSHVTRLRWKKLKIKWDTQKKEFFAIKESD